MSLSIAIVERTAPTTKYSGWRVLHKAEGGYQRNPATMPSVIPPIPSSSVDMTEEIQRMSFNLMAHFCPSITTNIWNHVHSWDRAYNNKLGFPNAQGGSLRRDYINDTDRNAPLPAYDKAQRMTGGNFVRGIERGDLLVLQAGIHGIDATKPMPSIETIVANNWYVVSVNVGPVSNEGAVSYWAQGKGYPIVFPLIFAGEIVFPLSYFERWEGDTLPDPLKVGA